MLRKPYLYILAICFFCCEEAPDFGTVDSADTPVVDIQTSETTFTEFPIEIEWEGNTAAREFIYELQFVDDPSIPHSWSGSNTTDETSMTFDNLDEGSYTFSVQGLYNQDNIGSKVTLPFTVDVISGPALRIYPLNQTANVGDTINVYLYFEEVDTNSVVNLQQVELRFSGSNFSRAAEAVELSGEIVDLSDSLHCYIENDPSLEFFIPNSQNNDFGGFDMTLIHSYLDDNGMGLCDTGPLVRIPLRILEENQSISIEIVNAQFQYYNSENDEFEEIEFNTYSGSVTVE